MSTFARMLPSVPKSFYPEYDLDPFSRFARRNRVTDNTNTGSSVATIIPIRRA